MSLVALWWHWALLISSWVCWEAYGTCRCYRSLLAVGRCYRSLTRCWRSACVIGRYLRPAGVTSRCWCYRSLFACGRCYRSLQTSGRCWSLLPFGVTSCCWSPAGVTGRYWRPAGGWRQPAALWRHPRRRLRSRPDQLVCATAAAARGSSRGLARLRRPRPPPRLHLRLPQFDACFREPRPARTDGRRRAGPRHRSWSRWAHARAIPASPTTTSATTHHGCYDHTQNKLYCLCYNPLELGLCLLTDRQFGPGEITIIIGRWKPYHTENMTIGASCNTALAY